MEIRINTDGRPVFNVASSPTSTSTESSAEQKDRGRLQKQLSRENNENGMRSKSNSNSFKTEKKRSKSVKKDQKGKKVDSMSNSPVEDLTFAAATCSLGSAAPKRKSIDLDDIDRIYTIQRESIATVKDAEVQTTLF
ncbi:unnamed protein product [Caenorhabditis bovis]|uniref:Uncharacterized protein n=1 Tax=Caenorhabditis bovis TaxID=2654633 RepID=A0A8S1F7B8_9PELO|nr:unnamed protein product [Caenorhabditis bovis]